MSKYKISERAKEDLFRIWHYGVYKFGRTQADKYAKQLFHHFDIIVENPNAFPLIQEVKPGYRKCVCVPNSLFYRLNKEHLEIVAIVGRQDIDEIF